MWTREQLKTNAKASLSRFHWYGVVVCLITSFLCSEFDDGIKFEFNFNFDSAETAGFWEQFLADLQQNDFIGLILDSALSSIASFIAVLSTLFGLALTLLIGNVVEVGSHRYFLIARERPATLSVLFSGFRTNYGGIVVTMLVRALYTFLWSLLFVIPGIVKSYSYRFVPYLLAENPNMDYRRAISLSEAMMQGHKLETFVLDWSFLGWEILSALTANILGILYVNPYIAATHTEHYCAIRAEAFANGLTDLNELPGFAPEYGF